VPKVHNKPIQRPRKGSNKESKRQPKCALVWRTRLSGVPPDSVRCTSEFQSELATFGNSGNHSAIFTGLSGVAPDCPVRQRSNGYSSSARTINALQCAPARAEVRTGARRRTGQWTVTVRWPSCQKLQWLEPKGQVTWLAHRTVSGGASDCPVRHATAASTNDSFGGWGYKYPQPPTIHRILVFSLHTSYKSYSIQYKTQTRDQILS
jgi:hypothetical protein